MIQFRNIDRSFTLRKAVVLFNKRGYELKASDVHYLYALYRCGKGEAVGIMALWDYLKSFYRSIPLDSLTSKLAWYESLGWIERVGVKYKVSFSGIDVLRSLDTRVKETRYDK